MRRRTLLTLALAAMLVAMAVFVASRPRCTCTLGHPEIPWVEIHDAKYDLDVPEDCALHGAETE